jgi:hypothetical protein
LNSKHLIFFENIFVLREFSNLEHETGQEIINIPKSKVEENLILNNLFFQKKT